MDPAAGWARRPDGPGRRVGQAAGSSKPSVEPRSWEGKGAGWALAEGQTGRPDGPDSRMRQTAAWVRAPENTSLSN